MDIRQPSIGPDEEVPGQMDRALAQLREIHHRVMNAAGAFEVAATLEALDMLEGQTCAGSPVSLARGMLHHLYACTLFHAGRKDASIVAGTEALRIDALAPFLEAAERAQLVCRIARQAADQGHWDLSIALCEKAIPMLDAHPAIEVDLLRECLDFCLQEAAAASGETRIHEGLRRI